MNCPECGSEALPSIVDKHFYCTNPFCSWGKYPFSEKEATAMKCPKCGSVEAPNVSADGVRWYCAMCLGGCGHLWLPTCPKCGSEISCKTCTETDSFVCSFCEDCWYHKCGHSEKVRP